MPEQQCWVQTVSPDKARVETFYVVLTALFVVTFSALIINFNQVSHDHAPTLHYHEISARYDLKPAEQGIFADLLLVYEDWTLQPISAPNSDMDALIADNWPPFTDTLEGKNRGAHLWQKLQIDGREGYLGLSQYPDLAGHFLWLLPASRENVSLDDFEVWLYQGDKPVELNHMEAEALTATGWHKINRANDIKR